MFVMFVPIFFIFILFFQEQFISTKLNIDFTHWLEFLALFHNCMEPFFRKQTDIDSRNLPHHNLKQIKK